MKTLNLYLTRNTLHLVLGTTLVLGVGPTAWAGDHTTWPDTLYRNGGHFGDANSDERIENGPWPDEPSGVNANREPLADYGHVRINSPRLPPGRELGQTGAERITTRSNDVDGYMVDPKTGR